ncbi:hypothetical protein A1O3_07179 [Capronia epimyces CBS 606.96]|uniref:Uncharacterized protein n=1 Tax=Capronia epimyces CBS 606.96 TaxID=1182542 RepID=W9XV90_9EURO|nr:uncharacterized protein A1O3_07179 [Capronia epimyces CBS 606.96]EXJ80891.1 hypothetical protein A1O3_07179 [Capronia epimyces CBS 606.96]
MWPPVCELLLFVAAISLSLVDAAKHTAITTLTPCPSASGRKTSAPITVTSQYQRVSTCDASAKACIRKKCWTQYDYSTYDFVSTVIPCPFASPSPVTTVTKTEQSVLVSRSSGTITNTHIISTATIKGGKPITVTSTVSTYTTINKEWNAIYKDLGPYAIPNYDGSGICTDCMGPHGEKMQTLDVIECVEGSGQPTVCHEYPEVWVFGSKPRSARTASAACSTKTSVSAAGIYVFEFTQHAPPATVQIPERTITYIVQGRVATTTVTATEAVFPSRDWTASVTRTCPRPTSIEFDITITKVIVDAIPYSPAGVVVGLGPDDNN